MKNYIELAHSTSAPIEPCRERLKNPALTSALLAVMNDAIHVGNELDALKRSIFYGKAEFPARTAIFIRHEDAQEAFRQDVVIELLHAAIGLATEAGEILQHLALVIFDGAPLDLHNIHEEIGDVQWYAAKACKFSGTTLDLEQVRNISKLAARYPNKFTDADALNRDLTAERAILERQIDPDNSLAVMTP